MHLVWSTCFGSEKPFFTYLFYSVILIVVNLSHFSILSIPSSLIYNTRLGKPKSWLLFQHSTYECSILIQQYCGWIFQRYPIDLAYLKIFWPWLLSPKRYQITTKKLFYEVAYEWGFEAIEVLKCETVWIHPFVP